jgi:hypothetical protein
VIDRIAMAIVLLGTASFCLPPAASAADLLLQSSFEIPGVSGTQPLTEGGDLTEGGENPVWESGRDRVNEGVELGLTDQVAHGGKQSLYVKFTSVDQPYLGAEIATDLIPVQAGASYTVSIWGCLDESEPVSGEATAKAIIEFEGMGEFEKKYISRRMGSETNDAFTSAQGWQELSETVEVPEGAASMRINWVWQVQEPVDPVNGIAYFDDFSVTQQ